MKATDRTISRQTASYIESIEMLNGIYETVSEALHETYNDEVAAQVLDADFYPQFKAMEAALGKLMFREVKMNITDASSKEI